MLHTNDPLATLGDLEMDLILSFLSVPETIVIRGVSRLWKARVDFRFTSGAIRRHYPTAEEAQAVYYTRDEEALAFRKVAYRYETRDEPNMARVIRKSHGNALWCFCSDHIVRTDVDREWLYIQRVFDPKNPQRQCFRTRNLGIKHLPSLQGKSPIGLGLKIQWVTGSDSSGVIVLQVGVEVIIYPHKTQGAGHPGWILAISMANSRVVWCHKVQLASYGHVQSRSYPASLGHGNACIVDLGGGLTILDLTTGQQKAYAQLLDHRFGVPTHGFRRCNLAAHPTMELCFATNSCSLSVFSTRTAQLIKKLKLDDYVPKQCWSWTKFHFGKSPISEGGGERAWLICDAWDIAEQFRMYGPTSAEAIITYEIDLEKLELVRVAIWKLAHDGTMLWTVGNSQSLQHDDVQQLPGNFARIHLEFLNPTTGTGYIWVQTRDHRWDKNYQMWAVKFRETSVDLSNPGKHPPIIYEVEDYHHVTLPKRMPRKGSGEGKQESRSGKNKQSILQRGRREFIFQNRPLPIDSYFSDRCLAFTTWHEIYLFGFTAQW